MDVRTESVVLPDENQIVVEKDSQDFPFQPFEDHIR